MVITELELNNFRNYKELKLTFHKELNIIYGNNAQGKTNILESMFLCASGRSHRTSKENELICFGENNFCVRINVEKKNDNTNIEYRNYCNNKLIKINDVEINKIGRLIGNLSVVMFSPEDILMLKEGPILRRRFVDISLSQATTGYFYDLQQYKKILINRNALLREIKINHKNIDTLIVWDNALADLGAKIMFLRQNFLKRLEDIIKPKHLYLTQSYEDVSIKYKPSFKIENNISLVDIKNIFLQKLIERQKEDSIRAFTSTGPHRDDFEVFINNIAIKNFGSQGQQRTAVLSLKLAEIVLMKEMTGENPVLLLDDFASELDKKRQNLLLNSIENVQVIITSTQKEILFDDNNLNAKYFNIINGTCLE